VGIKEAPSMTQASEGRLSVGRNAVHAPGSADHVAIVRAIAAFVIYEVSFYLAYRYGSSFSELVASPFWFPDSVLLCALLLTPTRWWWAFVLGALPIRLLLSGPPGLPPWFLLATFVIDSAKGLVTAWTLRRLLADPLNLRTIRDLVLYCLIAVVVIPAAAAFGGAAARAARGFDYWASWQQWFLGNVLAHAVITPAILWGIPSAARAVSDARRGRWIEGLLVAVGLIVTSYLAFQTPPGAGGFAEPRFYLPVPFLFWAAFRFGMLGASVAVVITTIISVAAALGGHGPFAGQSPADAALTLALQHFLLLRAAPLYVVAILFEQKQAAEDALTASERRYREVVESQTELVCRFLPSGALSFVNEAFCRAFRGGREALLGSDFVASLPTGVHDTARAQIRRAGLQIEHAEWECQVALADGTVGWRSWSCHPIIGPRGKVDEFQAIGQDITDRKHAEEADRNLTHVSRLAVVGELTAMVAHEINQPLGAILSNADAAEMLLETPDPPLDEIRQILSDIRRSDLRASEAVLRIRALLNKHEIQLQPVDLNGTIEDVLRLTAADLRRAEVEVRTELVSSLPPVSGDRVYLQQVLLNLFVNAMDAMKDTPVADRLLTVSTRLDDSGAIEVVVTDNGHGIPPDKLSGIFESFYSTKTDGMGLGLSIARSIVRTHGGRIWAENRRERGAAFHVTLKVA